MNYLIFVGCCVDQLIKFTGTCDDIIDAFDYVIDMFFSSNIRNKENCALSSGCN